MEQTNKDRYQSEEVSAANAFRNGSCKDLSIKGLIIYQNLVRLPFIWADEICNEILINYGNSECTGKPLKKDEDIKSRLKLIFQVELECGEIYRDSLKGFSRLILIQKGQFTGFYGGYVLKKNSNKIIMKCEGVDMNLREKNINLTFQLGTINISLEDLLEISPGSELRFSTPDEIEGDILLSGVPIGQGVLTRVNNQFRIKIKEIMKPLLETINGNHRIT